MPQYGRVAEEARFDGIVVTDHPAPTRKWLEDGLRACREQVIAKAR